MSEKTNLVFTNLFISLYNEKNQQRFEELHTCLINNLKSGVFDAVWIIAEVDEDGKVDYIGKFDVKPYTVNILPCTTRPTFRTFFNAINNLTNSGEINCVSNSDIYLEDLPILPGINECFALTRYEVDKNGTITFLNRKDSSDVWIFNSFIKIPRYADFHNLPGCDNRINWELKNVGYNISNPSLTIKTYHLHHGAKSYDGSKRINRPYHFLAPTE